MLGRLGVETSLVTASAAELWARYRSVTAGRRFLLAQAFASRVGRDRVGPCRLRRTGVFGGVDVIAAASGRRGG
jgi:hypothetical protein